jgi:tetratricopeptide (TPR) repeat protein
LAEALQVVVNDLPLEYEEDLRDELQRMAQTGQLPAESKDAFHYIIAKAAARSGHFGVAFEHAEKISAKFERYWQAQFILAVADYSLGRQTRAYDRMKKLKQDLSKLPSQEALASLVNINLGRMAFSEKKYSESVQHFRDIKKDHPMWVDALIEQGWSQLLAGDASGAIGNMYSLHAPFFKSVYKPESFVVRTIGYLNICQYGDAYRTLTTLEQEYQKVLEQIRQYRQSADSKRYYNSMIQYLRSPTTQASVDGVPFQVWREVGRHRDFLNLQTAINNRVDELEQQKFISGLIEKDRSQVRWLIKKSQERLADLSQKLKKSETNPELAKNVNEWKRLRTNELNVLEALKFELSVVDRSAQKYESLIKVAAERVHKRKAQMQLAAGEVLKTRMRNAENRLAAVIENNELLRYETFAGSGENIRYHATSTGQGDKVNSKRMPTHAKPESKELKWAFSGEYWADEIGHYRSSLKDNCAQSRQAVTK